MLGYLDCFSGISGDMLLGALIDAGWPLEELQAVVGRLKIGDVRVEAQRVEKQGISATWVEVIAPHEHVHRHRADLDVALSAARERRLRSLVSDLEEILVQIAKGALASG